MTKPSMALLILFMSFSSILIADWRQYWDKSFVYNNKYQNVSVYAYKTTATSKQVLVLNGGVGTISDNDVTQYNYMGQYFSNKGMQVIVLGFDYYGTFAHTTREAAQNVRNTISYVMGAGFVNRGFWLYSTAGGSIMAANMFDYNLLDGIQYAPLTVVCDRAIFVSGPVHGITRNDIQNTAIVNLMDSKGVQSLDSLNSNLSWAQRSAVWAEPMRLKDNGNGLRFVYSNDDYVYCANPSQSCSSSPSMAEAVNDWLVNATDGIWDAQSVSNSGLLKILPSGGHDPLQSSRATEILDFVYNNM
ncbi:MAG: hypothetical protein KME41_05745 [Candidatus Thiodiazotropha sp. (ex Lucina pensylvanica)]|nr:hypothetical protein [Candidatus Thiodiazotropha sp. (ex Lucina pensylvanica)]